MVSSDRTVRRKAYYAVKEIWSPIQIDALTLDATRSALRMQVRNTYAFTDLNQCSIEWQALRLPPPGGSRSGRRVVSSGHARAPTLAPGNSAELSIPLKSLSSMQYDVLQVTVKDPDQRELWTWTLQNKAPASSPALDIQQISTAVTEQSVIVRSEPYMLKFDKATGILEEISAKGTIYPLSGGPTLLAYKRVERRFEDVARTGDLKSLALTGLPQGIIAEVTYDGPLHKVTWKRVSEGIAMSYEYTFEDVADVLGVRFDLPSGALSKRWVGRGPYRIWQNRVEGGVFVQFPAALGFSGMVMMVRAAIVTMSQAPPQCRQTRYRRCHPGVNTKDGDTPSTPRTQLNLSVSRGTTCQRSAAPASL